MHEFETSRARHVESAIGPVAVLTITAIFALAFANFAPLVLPQKYFADAGYIQMIALGASPTVPDPSYLSTGQFYGALHLGLHPHVVASLAIILYYFSLLRAFQFGSITSTPLSTLMLACASLILAAVYVAPFSKEFVVLLAVIIILSLVGRRGGLLSIIGFILGYAIFFRSYWLLVAVLFVTVAVIVRWIPTRMGLALALISSVVLAGLALQVGSNENLNSLRSGLNAGRVGSVDAVTLIPQYIAGNSFIGGIANALVTLSTLAVPIPLFSHADPQYWAAGVLLLFISVSIVGIWVQVGVRRQIRQTSMVHADFRTLRQLLALSIALYVVQSLYVPDYGSALKHLTPVIPLVVAALACSSGLQTVDKAEPTLRA